jgi:hypothetical protein
MGKYDVWHRQGVIWIRFPGIVHGLTIEEAELLYMNLVSAMDRYHNGIDEDKM